MYSDVTPFSVLAAAAATTAVIAVLLLLLLLLRLLLSVHFLYTRAFEQLYCCVYIKAAVLRPARKHT
jgi:hypothetical protein